MSLSWSGRPRSRLRLATLLGMVVVVGIVLGAWREYLSPTRAWSRAIRSSDPLIRSDAWNRVRLDHEIRGLDRPTTAREVVALLDDPDPIIRWMAVLTLPSVDIGPVEAIAKLEGRLGDSSEAVRAYAATGLGEVVHRGGPGRDEAIAAITRAIRDPSASVRKEAIASLGQVIYAGGGATEPMRSGRKDDPALGLALDRLKDDDLAVRAEAAYVLACNDRGGEAVPMLASAVREGPSSGPPGRATDRAFLAMMILATHSDEAAAFLDSEIAQTREGYPERPRGALAWAARQSPEARARVKRLASAALRSESKTISLNAALLLHEIGLDEISLDRLIDALGDESVATRIEVVEALADLGDIDPKIVPALKLAAKDSNAEVRERALAAIEAIEWDELLEGMRDPVP